MFQCSTFTLFVARAKKSIERVDARQPVLQLRDKCFCSFPRRVLMIRTLAYEADWSRVYISTMPQTFKTLTIK